MQQIVSLAPQDRLGKRLNNEVFVYLAPSLRGILGKLSFSRVSDLEEIRLRHNQPLLLRLGEDDFFLDPFGNLVSSPVAGYKVTAEDIWKTVQLICQGSVYAFEEEFRQGYLTLPGGHRVGLAGKAVLEKGAVRTLKEIGSLNFRIARAVPGAAKPLLPYVLNFREKGIYHTLIISPPRAGKTTILRDLIRYLSYGVPSLKFPGINVGVVDERSELAACYQGVPQHDLGPRVDVLDHCPKAQGMIMLLRSMSPQVIATDEIGRPEDVEALGEMVNTGVGILTTVHAACLEELEERPYIRQIISRGIFQRYVLLSRRKGPGTIEGIWDSQGNEVSRKCSG
ncbi:MAG: Stage III sporulation protein AA [Thermoanaerobacterales bacterium 50_218]|nr:MAG: Stage III sporulation protein AA [Thermoanaerobacterales bacterium 50_218]